MTLPLGSQFSFEEMDDPFNAPFLHDDDDSDSDFISFGVGSDLHRKVPERLPAPKPLPPFDRRRSVQSPLPETVNTSRRKRLPGPAGMLPQSGGTELKLDIPHGSRHKKPNVGSVQCDPSSHSLSQSIASDTEESELMNRIQHDCGPVIWPLVEKYSIANVLQQITRGLLPRGKVPVMCGFLDDVELLPTDAKGVLKDKTGSLGCTIHRSVIKTYKEQLTNCVLLLLKQVSLFSPTGKKFYVNLTLSNIIRVYTPGQTFPALTSSRSVSQPLKNPPFSPAEFETLESECFRSNSPPVTPIPTRHNRVPNQLTPSSGLPAQHDFQPSSITPRTLHTSRKPPVQKDSQINASLSSDASDYRIRPSRPPIPPSVTNRNCQAPVRSGLGSLLRGSTHSVSTPEPTPDAFIRSQPFVTGHPAVDKLLNDDMDGVLSSLADESLNDIVW
ncbi:hypothetical protein CRM22_005900 [Opisthorchis felineus]|uniref:Homologous recombination OB-fold protein OB-fold domain-containing protein n=2 Tax=Opisthorchis felineus TaxID=147828 RepID=A0A4S2LNS3_OPIFE|nr:hypothetical protein CRM22_005900 [Opisthorchis felineus]